MALLGGLDIAAAFPPERIENNRFFSSRRNIAPGLESHGFLVEEITLTPRPTPLPSGMADWLQTFRSSVLELLACRRAVLPPSSRSSPLLRPVLCDREGNWTADYVRLRFRGPAGSSDSGMLGYWLGLP